MSLSQQMILMGQKARQASHHLALASSAQKNSFLHFLANAIEAAKDEILSANQRDIANAQHLDSAIIDRLTLSEKALQQMQQGLLQIAALEDPIGTIEAVKSQPSGIRVGQMRAPLGVVGIIYEARPNVTIDATGLCIKSGNAAILRGGSEAIECNLTLTKIIKKSLEKSGLHEDGIQIIPSKDRTLVNEMVTMDDYIDVLIPRGGKALIQYLKENARIPMIKHLDGVCHTYIDKAADITKAAAVAHNAKCQRYGTCNTTETLLLHHAIAADFLQAFTPLVAADKVELRACDKALPLLGAYPNLLAAKESDWGHEFLAPILAVKVVTSMEDAIAFINTHGSHHTDAILTENYSAAHQFLQAVDSASVMVNASTRFADGFEYGLGAEIGISTDKIHARGPVGLKGLTNLKYVVFGNGECRK